MALCYDCAVKSSGAPRGRYRGCVRDAAQKFPANVNVAVALSLAGVGPDRTQYEIWAGARLVVILRACRSRKAARSSARPPARSMSCRCIASPSDTCGRPPSQTLR